MTPAPAGQTGPRIVRFPEAQQEGIVTLGPDWRYRTVNHAAEVDLKRTAASLIGRNVWKEYPMLEDLPLGTCMRHVMATRETYKARQSSYQRPGHYLVTTITPTSDGGICIAYRNIAKAERHTDARFGT